MAKKQATEKTERDRKSEGSVRSKTGDVRHRGPDRSRQADGTIHVKRSDLEEVGRTFGVKFAVLGVASYKPESEMTAVEKMGIVRAGISKKELEQLKTRTTLDYDQLAKIFAVARATLINKKGVEKFNPTLSEKIVGLADIYSYGYDVFGEEDRFNEWMFRPNQALKGQTPFDLIDNQYGREEVRDLIGRIDYGVYS